MFTCTESAATSTSSEACPKPSLIDSTYSWSMESTIPVALNDWKPGVETLIV